MNKLLPKTKNNLQGFTLIELMVVVSIIAFLAVIGVAAFSQAQKTARDGRRRSDVEAIASAMESNYSASAGTYTAWTDSMFASGVQPKDPSSLANYAGNTVNSAKGFWVCATLENAGGNASAVGGGSGTSTYPTYTGSPLTYYCISSRQNQ